MRRLIACSLLVIILAGCAIGPNYRKPEIDTSPAWRTEEKEAQDTANTAWWEQFKDPVLNDLIQTALTENMDLRIATARVEEFYGRYGATRADLFPQLGYDASGARQQVTRTGQVPITGQNPPFNTYTAEFNASWELDIWGKLRRATEAARADLMSSEEGRSGVILSLVTSVATAYINLRSLDRQLEIAKETVKSREESVKLFNLRFSGGTVSELEVSQVASEYYFALSQIPLLEKSIAQQENALNILLGRNPMPVARGKTIDGIALPAVPAGLPSELLARRPDIRQAEQDLIAANARIGVAKGQYFPSISLTGFFGRSSTDLSELFEGPSRSWSYAGSLAGPIFTFGKIKGSVRAAQAVQQQTLFNYQRVIQNGFREVDDALVDQNRTRAQLKAQSKQVESLRTYARLARLRYENGYTSYLEVLDAERSLFNAELAYTQTHQILFSALVNVYKAMGGGWVLEADKIAVSADKNKKSSSKTSKTSGKSK